MNEEKITRVIYLSVLISLIIHFVLGVAVVKGGTSRDKRERVISFNVIRESKRDIKPEMPQKEIKPQLKPPAPRLRKVVDLTKKVKVVKPEEIKEEKKEEEAQNSQRFGIDKSLVDTSGKSSTSIAIPIGETMIGDPKLRKGDSDKFVKPSENTDVAANIDAISSMPKLIKEVKPSYPAEARRLGIEGSVVLLLEIDEEGNVVSAKLVKKMGYGMDEEALKAAYQLKFKPAYAGKTPVRAKIKYTFTFILED